MFNVYLLPDMYTHSFYISISSLMNIVCHTCSVNESEPSFEATRRYYFCFNLHNFLPQTLPDIPSLSPRHFTHSDNVQSHLLKCSSHISSSSSSQHLEAAKRINLPNKMAHCVNCYLLRESHGSQLWLKLKCS